MPKVYNKYHGDAPKDAVYIGRGSKWGNPYSHLPNTTATYTVTTREEAIESFRKMIMQNDTFWNVKRAEIKIELKGKDLVCFCAPKPCHGDILLEIANENTEASDL